MQVRGPVLVTGASSGIGAALAEQFARAGHPLLLVARDRTRLDAAAAHFRRAHGVPVQVLALDLCEPHAAELVVAEAGRSGMLPVQVLVNNAGFGLVGGFAQTSPDEIDAMIRLDVTVLVRLTRLLLPGMLAARDGRILNVASTAAFQPGPFMAIYYAAKAFVLSFGEALAHELRGSGVTATTLCPGPVRTRFQERAGLEGFAFVQGPLLQDVETVARVGYRATMRGRRVAVPGLLNRFGTILGRFAPRALVLRSIARMQSSR